MTVELRRDLAIETSGQDECRARFVSLGLNSLKSRKDKCKWRRVSEVEIFFSEVGGHC